MLVNVVPVVVFLLIRRRRGRGGGRVSERLRQKLGGPEDEEAAAAAEVERGAAGGPGKEGDAEEGGEAREEVERRAADEREDAVGRQRLRVARHALPRRRRAPRHPHHPPRPHRHELEPPNSAIRLRVRRERRTEGDGRGGAHGTKAGAPVRLPRGSRRRVWVWRFAAVDSLLDSFIAGSSFIYSAVYVDKAADSAAAVELARAEHFCCELNARARSRIASPQRIRHPIRIWVGNSQFRDQPSSLQIWADPIRRGISGAGTGSQHASALGWMWMYTSNQTKGCSASIHARTWTCMAGTRQAV